MSEAILRENPNDDLEGLVDDVQKHFHSRAKSIENRINRINEFEKGLNQEDAGKTKKPSKVKGIAKGVAATTVKTAADVELLASQEEPLIGLDGLGLLDRIKKGISSKEKVKEDEGSKLVDAAAKMKDEFSYKLDVLEKRINTLDNGISTYKKAAGKEKSHRSIVKSKTAPVNDLSEAYNLINEMYQDLTQRFDSLEKKLDEIEKKIEKEMPGIKLEGNSKVKKSMIEKAVDGIKGLFKGNQKADCNMENKAKPDISISDKENLDPKQNAAKDGNEPEKEELDTSLGTDQVNVPARGRTIKTDEITGEMKASLRGKSVENWTKQEVLQYAAETDLKLYGGIQPDTLCAIKKEGYCYLNGSVCENEKHRIADKGKTAANRILKKNRKNELAL